MYRKCDMKLLISACISILLWIQYPTEAVIKRWRPNTNYDNPDNWNVGRLPCDGDSLTFPAVGPPIFLEAEVNVIALELPINGEIILGEGAALVASATAEASKSSSQDTNEESEGSCSGGEGQTVEFTRTNYLNWLDPDNWCEAESANSDCLVDQPPRLDTERVPCVFDDVFFPEDSSFLVQQNYTSTDIIIKSLTIQGVPYSQNSLTEFLSTTEGKKQFNFNQDGEIKITQDTCEDITGCACGNDKGMMMHKICEFRGSKCSPLYCKTPIMPKGHCCPVCGTILTVDYHYGFKFSMLVQKISQNFIEGKKGDVFVITSKMSNERIQMVVQDLDNDGTQSKKTGKKIKEYIEKDIRGPQKLGLNSINMQVSGDSLTPSHSHVKGTKFFHSSGSIAGVVISVFIVLILVGAVMYCLVDRTQCRRRLKMPITLSNPFRRFSSGNDKGDLEMDDSISYLDITKAQEEENTFDNPMYNMPGPTAENLPETKGKQAVSMNNNEGPAIMDPTSVTFTKSTDQPGGSTSFANPLFGSYSSNPMVIDPSIRLNPAYTEDGIEEDSNI